MKKNEYKIIKSLDTAFQINDIYDKAKIKDEYFYYSGEIDSFNIINIVFNQENYKLNEEHLDKIKRKISKKQYITKLKTLVIVIGEEYKEISYNDNYDIIYLSYKNWKKEITTVITDINFDSDFNVMKAYEEQKGGNPIDLQSEIGKKYNSFEHKRRISNLPIFITLLIATIIIPLILNVFWRYFWSHNSSNSLLDYFNQIQFQLIFGGANHDLLIGLNQWWRILTYPFVSYGFFSIFINFIILFLFVRYMEINIGKIKSILLIALYPFIGIIITMMSYQYTLSGPKVVYALLIGAGAVSSYKKTDFTSLKIKNYILVLSIISFFMFLMNFNLILLLVVLFSFTTGASYGLFINHLYYKRDWFLYVPIIIFALFFLSSLVFISLEETTKIIPPQNSDVINSMKIYNSLFHILSNSSLTKLYNYYHMS